MLHNLPSGAGIVDPNISTGVGSPSEIEHKGKKTAEQILELYTQLEMSYAARNSRLAGYNSFFNGDHWIENEATKDSTAFQLVFNYCRTIVLKYTAILAHAPTVRIPISSTDPAEKLRALRREKFLRAVWEDLLRVWIDVETNASKKTFGVLQVLWAPGPDQPETIQVGEGEDKSEKKAYTESPIKFRSVKPEWFYPVYRTFETADDYLYVIRLEKDRLIEDLEELYGKKLQPTSQRAGTLGACDLLEFWDKDWYILVARTQYDVNDSRGNVVTKVAGTVLKEFKHGYSRLPFFLLQNLRNPDDNPADRGSLGDVDTVAQLNQHLNYMVSEAAEEIITNIHRPVVYHSDDHVQDPQKLEFKPGAVYPVGLEEKVETLKWEGMPNAVKEHHTILMQGIHDLSFLGAAGFGQFPVRVSGVALRLVMQSLEQILQLKVPIRRNALKDVCKFLFQMVENRTKKVTKSTAPTGEQSETKTLTPLVLWMQNKMGRFGKIDLTADDIQRDYFVDVDYGELLPRNEGEHDQNEVYKFKTGAQSLYTTLDFLGIESPDDELQRIKQELSDPVLNPEKVMMQLQAKQAQQQTTQQQGQPAPALSAQGGPGGNGQLPGGAQEGTKPLTGAPQNPAPMGAPAGAGVPGMGVPFQGRPQPPNPTSMRPPKKGEGM